MSRFLLPQVGTSASSLTINITATTLSLTTMATTTRTLGLLRTISTCEICPTLRVGQSVDRGGSFDMGNTGLSTATHVHFEVKYNQAAGDELAFVKVEGLPLKSYQTECTGITRTKYYPSTNRQ